MPKNYYFKTSRRFLTKCILILLIAVLNSSCTVLQWRSSDAEIKNYFNKKEIPNQLSYHTVDSLDIKIRVLEVKASKKNVNLVFFHGSPSSLSAWNGYLNDTSFIKEANLYAIDRPGYGYSNFGDEMASIKKQARIMSSLINEYKLENVIVVGSSYGGPLAARLAVVNKNVKGVVMISPAIDPKQEKKIWGSRLTQWWITRWLVPTGYRVAGDEKTVHAKELQLIENDWKQVNVPVLHIHGDVDDIVPYGNINYTKKQFNNIEIVTIPNTGHEIAWARPELIKPRLKNLIDYITKKYEIKPQ
ncbi:alpha/beta hydrolase [uncultured Lacinutrix sp.]|uniref:alpha/beta fold hydrolase n=1 Tax=uncultured Lacinutrix sp. TaxID=574032 RepID=UPI00260E1D87|nr:alpha/beta hydrolase [uncultured Lacinutrix sp.]